MLLTPPTVTNCHTFSDPSPSSVAYFMYGPLGVCPEIVLCFKIENTILFYISKILLKSIFKIVLKSILDNCKILFQNSFQNSFLQEIYIFLRLNTMLYM